MTDRHPQALYGHYDSNEASYIPVPRDKHEALCASLDSDETGSDP